MKPPAVYAQLLLNTYAVENYSNELLSALSPLQGYGKQESPLYTKHSIKIPLLGAGEAGRNDTLLILPLVFLCFGRIHSHMHYLFIHPFDTCLPNACYTQVLHQALEMPCTQTNLGPAGLMGFGIWRRKQK